MWNSKTDQNHTFKIKLYVYYFKANSTLPPQTISLVAIASPNSRFDRVVPNLEELLQYILMSKMTGIPINTDVGTAIMPIKSTWNKQFQLKDSQNFQIKYNKNISTLIPLHPYSTLQWLSGGLH